jgi:hypothetical protein
VLSFFSSRPNWDTPTPLLAGECVHTPLWFRGGRGGGAEGAPPLAGEGGSQFGRGDKYCGTLQVGIYVLRGVYEKPNLELLTITTFYCYPQEFK